MESLEDPDGYVCVEVELNVLLVVTGVEVEVGFLDDLLVNYREALLQQVTDCSFRAHNTLHTCRTHCH